MVSQVPGRRICSPVESTTMQPPDLGHGGNAMPNRRRQSVDGSGTGNVRSPAKSSTERKQAQGLTQAAADTPAGAEARA